MKAVCDTPQEQRARRPGPSSASQDESPSEDPLPCCAVSPRLAGWGLRGLRGLRAWDKG